MSVKRYDPELEKDGGLGVPSLTMYAKHTGSWVEYKDYAALEVTLAQRDAQIAALTAENVAMKSAIAQTIGWQESVDAENTESVRLLNELKTPATDAAANALRAEGAEAVAAYHKERIDALSDVHRRGANDHKVAYMAAMDVAHQLREGK